MHSSSSNFTAGQDKINIQYRAVCGKMTLYYNTTSSCETFKC